MATITNIIVRRATTVLGTIMATDIIIFTSIIINIRIITVVKNCNYYKRHNSQAGTKIIMIISL